jgi:hypothetical protein
MEKKIKRKNFGIVLNLMHNYTDLLCIFTLSGFDPQSPQVQFHTVCSLVWFEVNMLTLAILNHVDL